MAYDIIGIRKEHLDGLKKVIKEAPYGYLQNVCKSVGVSVSMDDIMGHINKGLEYRIISKEDPEYAWNSFLIARMAIEEHLKGYDDFLKDVKATLENGLAERILEPNEPDYLLKTIALTILAHKKKSENFTADEARAYYQELLEEDPFEENSMLALYSLLMYPLKVAICYIMKNFPIGLSMLLKKQYPDNLENRSRYLRVPLADAFSFINGMTSLGLRRLLADLCPSYCEDELIEAIQKGDYDEFKNICRTEKLTLSTDLSESVGFIQYNFFIPLDRMFNDDIVFSVGEDGDPYLNEILYSAGIPTEQVGNLISTIASCSDEIKDFIPWAQTNEQIQDCARAIAFFAGMYTYFDLFEIDEAEVVNKVFDNPRFKGVIQLAQEAYFGKYEQWPPKSKILFTPEQKAQVERVVLGKNDPKQEQNTVTDSSSARQDGKKSADVGDNKQGKQGHEGKTDKNIQAKQQDEEKFSAPYIPASSLENLKKRSLDDFVFVKEAGFHELYNTLESAVSVYDEDHLKLFCQQCRFPLEQALEDGANIAGIEGIPKFAGDRIGRLGALFTSSKERNFLFPDSCKDSFSTLNRTVCKYLHNQGQPSSDKWNGDAQLCYKNLVYICHWLVWFKGSFQKFIECHGPIDFKTALDEYTATRRRLPEIASIANRLLPGYDDLIESAIDENDAFKRALQRDLKSLYDMYYGKAQEVCNDFLDTIDEQLIEADHFSSSIGASLAKTKQLIGLLPRVAAVRHIYSYFSVVYPILFHTSWSPKEISHLPFSGKRLSAEEIYSGLANSNSFVVKVLLNKLECPLSAKEGLLKKYEERASGGFADALKKLSCDISSLHDFANFLPYLLRRDYGLLQRPKEASEWLNDSEVIFTIPHPLYVDREPVLLDSPSLEPSDKRNHDLLLLVSNRVGAGISSFISVLMTRFGIPYGERFFSYAQEYIDAIFEVPETGSVMEELMGVTSIDLKAYHYPLPDGLFNGAVDTVHEYIPGLKNELKDKEKFALLFDYILRIGGICTDQEAGALLRAFTGYPVENAKEKAKWGTDYHIVYYLVKYMFTPKKSYVKMRECIDIYYPSDDERQRAEKSPSSYAERIGGDDAPSIIETLHRLSDVFPKPEEPVTN